MTQIVSAQYRRSSNRIGFSHKSLKARKDEFRARAGALGRSDIIEAFNEHPAQSYSYKPALMFVVRVAGDINQKS